MNKILFINTMHLSMDDRTFFHHAAALYKVGNDVSVYSTLETKNEISKSIQLCSEKIHNLGFFKQTEGIRKQILKIQPDTIICDSPIGVLSSIFYKNPKTIIYDVTEWIPSKKQLKNTNKLLIPIKFLGLLLLNLMAGLLTTKFIFGEKYKSKLFKLFFWKKSIISTYYPDLTYIKAKEPRDISQILTMYYSGWFNADKGFDKVIELTKLVANLQSNKKIILKLTGSYINKNDKKQYENTLNKLPSNVDVQISSFKNFEEYCVEIGSADVFLDLRVNDFENTRCLPIKLFYYLACGRPVFYSDLKAIKDVLDLSMVGSSFNQNVHEIAINIANYMNNSDNYLQHCKKAKELSLNNYNWKKIENEFLTFVNLKQ